MSDNLGTYLISVALMFIVILILLRLLQVLIQIIQKKTTKVPVKSPPINQNELNYKLYGRW